MGVVSRYFTDWFDSQAGFRRTAYLWSPTFGVDPLGLQVETAAMSVAGLNGWVAGDIQTGQNQEPGLVLYPAVSQVLTTQFCDSAGNSTTVTIPAPLASLFLPDGQTLDATNPIAAIFIAKAVSGGLFTSAGTPCNTYQAGFLQAAGKY